MRKLLVLLVCVLFLSAMKISAAENKEKPYYLVVVHTIQKASYHNSEPEVVWIVRNGKLCAYNDSTVACISQNENEIAYCSIPFYATKMYDISPGKILEALKIDGRISTIFYYK